MRRKNWAFIIGGMLILFLFLLMLFPGLFTNRNPYALSIIRFFKNADGSLGLETPPYAPGATYLLGSDQVGRDILSLLVYGTRLTLGMALIVTFSRFALAVPFGLMSGHGSRFVSGLIDRFNLIFTTFPALLLAILVLKMDFFESLYKAQSIVFFVAVLTLVGFSAAANQIALSTRSLRQETFILAEEALGKSRGQIIKKNLLPHLMPEIIVLFFMEVARVLTFMMQLGIFGVFIGNLRLIKDSGDFGYSYYNTTFEPEWSSMLGATKEYIRVAPWLIFPAAGLFFISVFAFNLFGEGLRQKFQDREGRFIPAFRHFINGEFRRLHWNKKWVALVVISLLLLGAGKYLEQDTPPYMPYAVEDAYDGPLVAGSDAALSFADELASIFDDMGLEPVDGDIRTQAFDPPTQYLPRYVDVFYGNESKVEEDEVTMLSGFSFEAEGEVRDVTLSLFDATEMDIESAFAFIDTRLVGQEAVGYHMASLLERGCLGILVPRMSETGSLVDESSLPVIAIDPERLNGLIGESVAIASETTPYAAPMANVLGQITGQDDALKDQAMVIGVSYSDLQAFDQEKLSLFLSLVQTLKANEDQLSRTIVFIAFSDREKGRAYYAAHPVYPPKKTALFLDLDGLAFPFERLTVNDQMAPISRYLGYAMVHGFEKRSENWIEITSDYPEAHMSFFFRERGLTTLYLESFGEGSHDREEMGRMLVDVIMKNSY